MTRPQPDDYAEATRVWGGLQAIDTPGDFRRIERLAEEIAELRRASRGGAEAHATGLRNTLAGMQAHYGSEFEVAREALLCATESARTSGFAAGRASAHAALLDGGPDIEAIEARLARIPAWTCSPRDVRDVALIEAGADPLALAEAAPDADVDGWFLGWELNPPIREADRGLTGPQVAELIRLRADALALLAEVRRLRAPLQ
mgnify:CR=1 FL=1